MKSQKESKPTKEKRETLREVPKIGIAWVAAIVVVAFLLGFVVGGLVFPASEQPSSIPQFQGQTTPRTAPPLSEEQIQQGQMPPGHPPIGGEVTTPTAPTASATPGQNP